LVLHSNDPESPHVVSLSWFGKRPPIIVPAEVNVTVRPGEVCEESLRVVYMAGPPLVFEGSSDCPDWLSFTTESQSVPHDAVHPAIPTNDNTESMFVRFILKAPDL